MRDCRVSRTGGSGLSPAPGGLCHTASSPSCEQSSELRRGALAGEPSEVLLPFLPCAHSVWKLLRADCHGRDSKCAPGTPTRTGVQVCILPALLPLPGVFPAQVPALAPPADSSQHTPLALSLSPSAKPTQTHPLPRAKSCWGTKAPNSLLILSRAERGRADRTLSGSGTCHTANLGSTSALLSGVGGAGGRLQLCRRRDSSASPHPHARKAPARLSPTSICLYLSPQPPLFAPPALKALEKWQRSLRRGAEPAPPEKPLHELRGSEASLCEPSGSSWCSSCVPNPA